MYRECARRFLDEVGQEVGFAFLELAEQNDYHDRLAGRSESESHSSVTSSHLSLISHAMIDKDLGAAVLHCFRPVLVDVVARLLAQADESTNVESEVITETGTNLSVPIIDHVCEVLSVVLFHAPQHLRRHVGAFLSRHECETLRLSLTRLSRVATSCISSDSECRDLSWVDECERWLLVAFRLRQVFGPGCLQATAHFAWALTSVLHFGEHCPRVCWLARDLCNLRALSSDDGGGVDGSCVVAVQRAGAQILFEHSHWLKVVNLLLSSSVTTDSQDDLQDERGSSMTMEVSRWPQFEANELHASVACVGREQLLFFQEQSLSSPRSLGLSSSPLNTLVETTNVEHAVSQLALAVANREPIWLSGPTAAGKTVLLEALAQRLAVKLIRVHVGDDADPKVLFGSYTCDKEPGQFRWSAGVITRAMRDGHWLLLEDANLLPAEVMGALEPLLSTGRVYITDLGVDVEASPGFRLFATSASASSDEHESKRRFKKSTSIDQNINDNDDDDDDDDIDDESDDESVKGGLLGIGVALSGSASRRPLWRTLSIRSPSLKDLRHIFSTLFPSLQVVSQQVIRSFKVASRHLTLAASGQLSSAHQRPLTARDLLRFCRRAAVAAAAAQSAHSSSSSSSASGAVANPSLAIFAEALDCFASSLPENDRRSGKLAQALAAVWGVPIDHGEHLLLSARPALDGSDVGATLRVGRVLLSRAKSSVVPSLSGHKGNTSEGFAQTDHSLRMLERLAACVAHDEPALLVGPAGSGKTALVQRLARSAGRRLTVLNLGRQTDTSDLLGGFRPVDPRTLGAPLFRDYDQLFGQTFSRRANRDLIDLARQASDKGHWKRLAAIVRKTVQSLVRKTDKAAAAAERDSASSGGTSKGQQQSSKRRKTAKSTSSSSSSSSSSSIPESLLRAWNALGVRAAALEERQRRARGGLAFEFAEGPLARALRCGDWILLDELNLAPSELLQSLCGVLEARAGEQVVLVESPEPLRRHEDFRVFGCMNPPGDVGKRPLPPALRNRFTELFVDEITSHEDLERIARAQLAATPLPAEFIGAAASCYLAARRLANDTALCDGHGARPHYSLRAFVRALTFARRQAPLLGAQQALREGFEMTLAGPLESGGRRVICKLISDQLLISSGQATGDAAQAKRKKQRREQQSSSSSSSSDKRLETLAEADERSTAESVPLAGFMLPRGPVPLGEPVSFVVTKTVMQNLIAVARAAAAGLAVLLQGPTSVGKTSLVGFVARRCGAVLRRINNHEHTDVDEYLGSYVSDTNSGGGGSGNLVWRDGLLARAVRAGEWVVLDELNLAPADVLEALNRLLDDNRQLLVPATGEVISAHPRFRLFATQNPPGAYGGRKQLSLALRSRFVELHVDDLPDDEAQELLEQRGSVPESFAQSMIETMRTLQRERAGATGRGADDVGGRHAVVTMRDLFRWAHRRPGERNELAETGFMLLAERLRRPLDRQLVRSTIDRCCRPLGSLKSVDKPLTKSAKRRQRKKTATKNREQAQSGKLDESFATLLNFAADEALSKGDIYAQHSRSVALRRELAALALTNPLVADVVWTRSLRRMLILVDQCLTHEEPALIVGETASGKTTVCQVLAALRGQKLRTVSCHRHTDASDFIGCLRPSRHAPEARKALRRLLIRFLVSASSRQRTPEEADERELFGELERLSVIALLGKFDRELASRRSFESALKEARKKRKTQAHDEQDEAPGDDQTTRDNVAVDEESMPRPQGSSYDSTSTELVSQIQSARADYEALFTWVDGPLVEAMKHGDLFMIDEISLADDAVLERLNSCLELERSLVLAERGGLDPEEVRAHPNFRIVATMNPGGDHGKRELSPAMRSRFTEVWVPPAGADDADDLRRVIRARLHLHDQPTHELLESLVSVMLEFVAWFNESVLHRASLARLSGLSATAFDLRAILSWIAFINSCAGTHDSLASASARTHLTIKEAFVNGAMLAFVDGMGVGGAAGAVLAAAEDSVKQLEESCHSRLLQLSLKIMDQSTVGKSALSAGDSVTADASCFKISSFGIAFGPLLRAGIASGNSSRATFSLEAPTTASNAARVLRAMQLRRPILLEGSPGVGKTSLVGALAAASGHRLVRINLSEQSDMSDLIGSELPCGSGGSGADQTINAEEEERGLFAWTDGVLLRALKAGDWVLLDEMNLAPQAVLEGLNAILDHRGECYVPELNETFLAPASFRVFACQNPASDGAGRKGLPKSFLSRFTAVRVRPLQPSDLEMITEAAFPQLPRAVLESAVDACSVAAERASLLNGGPWEFNLRDVFRWCSLLAEPPRPELLMRSDRPRPVEGVSEALRERNAWLMQSLILSRLRGEKDRQRMSSDIRRRVNQGGESAGNRRTARLSPLLPSTANTSELVISASYVQIGHVWLERRKNAQRRRRHQPLSEETLGALRVQPNRLACLEQLALAISLGSPALLVGQSGTGKASLARTLAAMTGNRLREISLAGAADTGDLLGSFVALSGSNDNSAIASAVKEELIESIDEGLADCSDFILYAFEAHAGRSSARSSLSFLAAVAEEWQKCLSAVKQATRVLPLSQFFALLKQSIELSVHIVDQVSAASSADKVANRAGLILVTLKEKRVQVVRMEEKLCQASTAGAGRTDSPSLSSTSLPCRFEWFDGVLVRSAIQGDWLLINQSQRCPPAVLDRLNALLEPGGSLSLFECGSGVDGPRQVRPHPDFRVILTVTHSEGEVSRAMRNRSIEIFVPALFDGDSNGRGETPDEEAEPRRPRPKKPKRSARSAPTLATLLSSDLVENNRSLSHLISIFNESLVRGRSPRQSARDAVSLCGLGSSGGVIDLRADLDFLSDTTADALCRWIFMQQSAFVDRQPSVALLTNHYRHSVAQLASERVRHHFRSSTLDEIQRWQLVISYLVYQGSDPIALQWLTQTLCDDTGVADECFRRAVSTLCEQVDQHPLLMTSLKLLKELFDELIGDQNRHAPRGQQGRLAMPGVASAVALASSNRPLWLAIEESIAASRESSSLDDLALSEQKAVLLMEAFIAREARARTDPNAPLCKVAAVHAASANNQQSQQQRSYDDGEMNDALIDSDRKLAFHPLWSIPGLVLNWEVLLERWLSQCVQMRRHRGPPLLKQAIIDLLRRSQQLISLLWSRLNEADLDAVGIRERFWLLFPAVDECFRKLICLLFYSIENDEITDLYSETLLPVIKDTANAFTRLCRAARASQLSTSVLLSSAATTTSVSQSASAYSLFQSIYPLDFHSIRRFQSRAVYDGYLRLQSLAQRFFDFQRTLHEEEVQLERQHELEREGAFEEFLDDIGIVDRESIALTEAELLSDEFYDDSRSRRLMALRAPLQKILAMCLRSLSDSYSDADTDDSLLQQNFLSLLDNTNQSIISLIEDESRRRERQLKRRHVIRVTSTAAVGGLPGRVVEQSQRFASVLERKMESLYNLWLAQHSGHLVDLLRGLRGEANDHKTVHDCIEDWLLQCGNEVSASVSSSICSLHLQGVAPWLLTQSAGAKCPESLLNQLEASVASQLHMCMSENQHPIVETTSVCAGHWWQRVPALLAEIYHSPLALAPASVISHLKSIKSLLYHGDKQPLASSVSQTRRLAALFNLARDTFLLTTVRAALDQDESGDFNPQLVDSIIDELLGEEPDMKRVESSSFISETAERRRNLVAALSAADSFLALFDNETSFREHAVDSDRVSALYSKATMFPSTLQLVLDIVSGLGELCSARGRLDPLASKMSAAYVQSKIGLLRLLVLVESSAMNGDVDPAESLAATLERLRERVNRKLAKRWAKETILNQFSSPIHPPSSEQVFSLQGDDEKMSEIGAMKRLEKEKGCALPERSVVELISRARRLLSNVLHTPEFESLLDSIKSMIRWKEREAGTAAAAAKECHDRLDRVRGLLGQFIQLSIDVDSCPLVTATADCFLPLSASCSVLYRGMSLLSEALSEHRQRVQLVGGSASSRFLFPNQWRLCILPSSSNVVDGDDAAAVAGAVSLLCSQSAKGVVSGEDWSALVYSFLRSVRRRQRSQRYLSIDLLESLVSLIKATADRRLKALEEKKAAEQEALAPYKYRGRSDQSSTGGASDPMTEEEMRAEAEFDAEFPDYAAQFEREAEHEETAPLASSQDVSNQVLFSMLVAHADIVSSKMAQRKLNFIVDSTQSQHWLNDDDDELEAAAPAFENDTGGETASAGDGTVNSAVFSPLDCKFRMNLLKQYGKSVDGSSFCHFEGAQSPVGFLISSANMIQRSIEVSAASPASYSSSSFSSISTSVYEWESPAETSEVSRQLFELRRQVKLVLSKLNGLTQNVAGLSALWAVYRSICQALSQSRQSPLMKVCASVESVLRRAAAWDHIAPREHRLLLFTQPLADAVSRWRRMELNGWRKLLSRREYAASLADCRGERPRTKDSLKIDIK